jgi:hypothetical protein
MKRKISFKKFKQYTYIQFQKIEDRVDIPLFLAETISILTFTAWLYVIALIVNLFIPVNFLVFCIGSASGTIGYALSEGVKRGVIKSLNKRGY